MKPESLLAAVELHRPVLFDQHVRETADPAKAKHGRCRECSVNTGPEGCRTWVTANA